MMVMRRRRRRSISGGKCRSRRPTGRKEVPFHYSSFPFGPPLPESRDASYCNVCAHEASRALRWMRGRGRAMMLLLLLLLWPTFSRALSFAAGSPNPAREKKLTAPPPEAPLGSQRQKDDESLLAFFCRPLILVRARAPSSSSAGSSWLTAARGAKARGQQFDREAERKSSAAFSSEPYRRWSPTESRENSRRFLRATHADVHSVPAFHF